MRTLLIMIFILMPSVSVLAEDCVDCIDSDALEAKDNLAELAGPLSTRGAGYKSYRNREAYAEAYAENPESKAFREAYSKHNQSSFERGDRPLLPSDTSKYHALYEAYTILKVASKYKDSDMFPSPEAYLDDPQAWNRVLSKGLVMSHYPTLLSQENTLKGCSPIINDEIDCGEQGIFKKATFTRRQVGEASSSVIVNDLNRNQQGQESRADDGDSLPTYNANSGVQAR